MRAQTRHSLKEDRFSRTTIQVAERTADWTVEHKSKLIVGTLVVVVIVAAVLGGWYYLSQQDEKASVQLSQAMRTMDTQLRPPGVPPQPDFPSFASANERSSEAR